MRDQRDAEKEEREIERDRERATRERVTLERKRDAGRKTERRTKDKKEQSACRRAVLIRPSQSGILCQPEPFSGALLCWEFRMKLVSG